MAAFVMLARTPLRLHSACRSRRGSARKSILSSLRAAATVLLSCHLGLSSSPPFGLLLFLLSAERFRSPQLGCAANDGVIRKKRTTGSVGFVYKERERGRI